MSSTSNSLIIKNTGYLYIRMFILTLVKLYTSRVVLQVLGINDFGVWSAITTFILSFNFISTPLIGSIQRFLNYEMGCGGKRLKEIWGTSFYIIIFICLIIFLLLETFGVWFLANKMHFGDTSLHIVNIVYQLSVISVIICIIRLPFEAAVISYEKFSVYSIFSVIETFLLLGIAFLLKADMGINHLVLYGILYSVTQLITFILYFSYSKKLNCIYFPRKVNKEFVKEIAQYSGWNFVGAVSSVSASSGLNILLNMFFGVVVNAAYTITMQVSNAISQLSNNLMTALTPQITKNYAEGNLNRVTDLSINGCKYSFLLLLFPILPMWYNMGYILTLWLGNNVPANSILFCRVYFIYLLIASFATPLTTVILASPNIRNYQIVLFPIVLSNILLSYIFLKLGAKAQIVFYIKIFVEFVILGYRLYFLKKKISFPIKKFIKETIKPILLVLIIVFLFYWIYDYYNSHVNTSDITTLLLSTCLYVMIYLPLCWFIVLSADSRNKIINFVRNHINIGKCR